jgi:RND family efflux transporter MFP subunit
MTLPLIPTGRILLTLVFVGLASALGWHFWDYYMNAPWTRDGKIRADVVRLSPDVSGLVRSVEVADNQRVEKGAVVFRIDSKRFELAVQQAEANLASAQAAAAQAAKELNLYERLGDGASTKQRIDQALATKSQADAAVKSAAASLGVAQLEIERSVVRAPVNGYLTNFHLRPGNYVQAGAPVTAIVDSDSYYVIGYFEENKLPRINIGERAAIYAMGVQRPFEAHVTGIAAGIEDRELSEGDTLLANVNPTFSWVRLAQRVPVRFELKSSSNQRIVAGQTVSIFLNETMVK